MEISDPRSMVKLALLESIRILRSSKCLILLICGVFININVIDPIRELSHQMGEKVSFLEPFAALSNSGFVLLFIPLLYLVMMSDFPDNTSFRYFYCSRMSKKRWVVNQVFCIYISALLYLMTVILFTVILSADFISFRVDFSDAVRYYAVTFPERSFSYVALLFPLNMLNQMTLMEVVNYSLFALYMYLILLVQITLFFSIIQKKIIGIVLDFIIVFVGMVLSSIDTGFQWVFPLSHTVSWWHFREVAAKPIFPLEYSIIYLLTINVAMTVMIMLNSKKARPE